MKTVSAKRAEPKATDGPVQVDHDDRLIRWMLERSPAQRLETPQNFVEGIVALQHAQRVSQ